MKHRLGKATEFTGVEEQGVEEQELSQVYEPQSPLALAVAGSSTSRTTRTSGLDIQGAIKRALYDIAGAASGLGKKFKMEKSLAEHLDGLADSMSGVMDYLVDGKRMLFRTEAMRGAMGALLDETRTIIDIKLERARAEKLNPVDMTALRKYIKDLKTQLGEGFTYQKVAHPTLEGQSQGSWVLSDELAHSMVAKMSEFLNVSINRDVLKYQLEGIVNAAVDGMEAVTPDATDRLRLFFKEKYYAAALALAETKSNLAARATYAGTYVAEKAKVAGAYALKAGTMLNQYLLQPAYRTIQNLFATGWLLCGSLVAVSLALMVAASESGKIGLPGEKFTKSKAIFAAIKEAWKERFGEVKEHITQLKAERAAAMGVANSRVTAAKTAAKEALVGADEQGGAAQTLKDAIGSAASDREKARDELTASIKDEREKLGKAKAKKKVGQRVETALRDMARVDRSNHGSAKQASSSSRSTPLDMNAVTTELLLPFGSPRALSPGSSAFQSLSGKHGRTSSGASFEDVSLDSPRALSPGSRASSPRGPKQRLEEGSGRSSPKHRKSPSSQL